MRGGFKVTLDHTNEIFKAIRDLESQRVMVGIPAENAGRNDGPLSNAELGYIHDRGAPAVNIPARPFLSEGIEQAQPEITAKLEAAATAALDGNSGGLQKGLTSAGEVAVKSVRAQFVDNSWPELSDTTIRGSRCRKDGTQFFKGRKKTRAMQKRFDEAEAAGGDLSSIKGEYKPLIDKGNLRKSITHVIRKVK